MSDLFVAKTATFSSAPCVVQVCRNCQRDFLTLAKEVRRGHGIFCSRSCQSSDVMKRRNRNQSGSLNPAWKGGVSKDHMRYVRRHIAKYPNEVRVRRLFADAVRRGQIVRPESCSACGKACKPHGHHDNYRKPYTVRWLCQPCHNRHHAALRKAS